ncbi:MAG TPA: hypothetical protein VH020_14705 [Stellaceae bacterium]|nr:hypothetical protein [Stellaceae bacterium]
MMTTSIWPAVGAVGTWVIAVIAIWGDAIRGRLFRPNLEISVLNTTGSDLIPVAYPDGTRATGRFYHLKIANSRPSYSAGQVQVWILRVEREGPDGKAQTVLSEPVPLRWRHQQIQPLRMNIAAVPGQADLLCVNERGELTLETLIEPNNFQRLYTGHAHLWLTVQAQGDRFSSKPHRVEIAWDGEWDQGQVELANHLRVSVVVAPSDT